MANENIANKIEQAPVIQKPETVPVRNPERVQEVKIENSPIEKKKETEGSVSEEKSESASSGPVAPAASDSYHQRRELEIDALLAEGLGETFLAMPSEKQKLFKEEGEKTAKKINLLLDAAKVNLNKVVSLIRRWLKLITGINRFYLDQEAKIKADKIIKIKNKL